MPLPRASEQAADRAEALLTALDRALVDYVADGGGPPPISRLLVRLEVETRAAIEAAMLEVDPDVTDEEIAAALVEAMAPIESAVRNAEATAVRRRRAAKKEAEPEDDETRAAFVLRVGAVAAFVALAAELDAVERRKLGQSIGVALPKPTAAHVKMIVRTESAIQRNTHAATVVDRRNRDAAGRAGERPRTGDWVVFVEDARKGPTDKPCEDVNRKYATAKWARRHPVEHPNCTRRTKPTKLPDGRRVTLFE